MTETLTQRARDVAGRLSENGDHARGCAGRCCACTCGYDDAVDHAATKAATIIAELIERVEWRDIETAPRDWTDVLVFSPEHEGFNCCGVFSAFCDSENDQWLTHGPSMNMEISPTHWLPLPQPPSVLGKQEGEG